MVQIIAKVNDSRKGQQSRGRWSLFLLVSPSSSLFIAAAAAALQAASNSPAEGSILFVMSCFLSVSPPDPDVEMFFTAFISR
jgi:hypothetical protein